MAKRKTPPALAEMILTKQPAYLLYVERLIEAKNTVPVECQGQHIREGSEEKWIARMEGYNTALEDALFSAGCYAGYMYVGEQHTQTDHTGEVSTWRESVKTDHPQFREWRRVYFTRGV